jgi:hypothetical protein
MDWLSLHDGHKGWENEVVHLTNSNGVQVTIRVQVTCHTRGSGPDPMVFSMEARTIEEVPAVNEYPMSIT